MGKESSPGPPGILGEREALEAALQAELEVEQVVAFPEVVELAAEPEVGQVVGLVGVPAVWVVVPEAVEEEVGAVAAEEEAEQAVGPVAGQLV